MSSTNAGYLSRDAIILYKVACASREKEGAGASGIYFASIRASTLSCETNKSIRTFTKIVHFVKYSVLLNPCLALRAALSQGSTPVF